MAEGVCELELKLLGEDDRCEKCGHIAKDHPKWTGTAHSDRGGADRNIQAQLPVKQDGANPVKEEATKEARIREAARLLIREPESYVRSMHEGDTPVHETPAVAASFENPPEGSTRTNYIVKRRDGVKFRYKDIDIVSIFQGDLTLARSVEPIYQKVIRVFARGTWEEVWDENEGEGESIA